MIMLAKQRADVRFLLVGDSSESAPDFVSGLHRQIEAAGLSERFHFVPHLADPYLAYRASSVVVHSSIEPEPFGMVVIEAMAAGVPVVASPLGGPAEIIEDGVSGLLADPCDSQALTSAVLRLMDDRELRDNIAAAGIRRVQQRYSEHYAIDSLLRVYQTTLNPVAAMITAQPAKGM
jgi:glycosyltransferase involved in cell wall biosynthesis